MASSLLLGTVAVLRHCAVWRLRGRVDRCDSSHRRIRKQRQSLEQPDGARLALGPEARIDLGKIFSIRPFLDLAFVVTRTTITSGTTLLWVTAPITGIVGISVCSLLTERRLT